VVEYLSVRRVIVIVILILILILIDERWGDDIWGSVGCMSYVVVSCCCCSCFGESGDHKGGGGGGHAACKRRRRRLKRRRKRCLWYRVHRFRREREGGIFKKDKKERGIFERERERGVGAVEC
jgi:hypothetical protein